MAILTFNPRSALIAFGFAAGLALAIPVAAFAQSSMTSTYGDIAVTITGNGSMGSTQTGQGIEARLNDHLVIIRDTEIEVDGQIIAINSASSVVVDGTDGFSVLVDGTRVAGESELDRLMADAAAGDAYAQNNLAVRYNRGEGVEQDSVRAMQLYRQAAEQGLDVAQSNLAFGYWDGRGVENDDAAAMHWAGLAAAQGDVIAMRLVGMGHYFGRGHDQDRAEAARIWAEAANLGDATAAFNMGVIVRDGDGVLADRDLAILWFERAVELEHPDAAANLEALLSSN